jgi:phospholipid N-methyltransferase
MLACLQGKRMGVGLAKIEASLPAGSLRDFSASRKKSVTSHLMLFARNFFKHPAMLGSVIPSSPFLVNDVLNHVNWNTARVLVEFGPGVGTMTQEILNRMRPDAILIALELNPDFVNFLQEKICDSRLRVVNTSAADVRRVLADMGLGHADYIVSGIPYTNMPDEVRRDIMQQSRAALHEKGALLIYQFTRTVLPYLQSHFKNIEQGFQFWNILPARIFHCTP